MSEHPYRVLIADDEAAIRNGLSRIIPWEQYDATVIATAQDGAETLEKIQSLEPDLVVIDIKMPKLDGLEVIKQTKQAGLSIRFLILSGYNDFALAQKAIKYGANAYFLKPLKIDEFKNELSLQFRELSLQKEQKSNQENYSTLLDISRIFLLNQLIHSEIRTKQELDRRLLNLPLSIQSGSCRILLCSCCSVEYDVNELLDSLKLAFASFAFEIWTPNEHTVAVALNVTLENADRLYSALAHALRRLHAKNRIRYYAGIGKVVPDLQNLSDSFRSAMSAMAYHIYESGDDIYDETILCQKRPSSSPDSALISSILQAVTSGDCAVLSELCKQYIQSLFYVPMPSPDYIHGMCIFLLTRVRMMVLAKNPGLTDPLEIQSDIFTQFHTIDDVTQWLYDSVCVYQATLNGHPLYDPLIETVKNYIQDHLDSNIKAADLAKLTNFSEAYFSIYFKSKTGETFRDYILNTRIAYAKKLLSEGTHNVSEIATLTGYQDYRSFSRAFKKVTGVSPSEYHSI